MKVVFQRLVVTFNGLSVTSIYTCIYTCIYTYILNNKINLSHYRSLKVVYQDECSTFQELLIKDKSFSMYHRNLQCLAVELYKVKSGNAPFLLNEIFTRDIPENSIVANLRSSTNFYNFHNPQKCPVWNRNFTCPGHQNMEYYYTQHQELSFSCNFQAKNKKLDSSKLSL